MFLKTNSVNLLYLLTVLTNMKKYLWEREVVSIEDNVVTFKGGEQKVFPPIRLKLITEKKMSPQELKDLKLQFFQAIMQEAFDTLGLTTKELVEWVQLVQKKWTEDQEKFILNKLGVNSFDEITYETIHS